ncbi:MAG: hypothetical protein DRQ59_00500 [Gammaproteobacteria bacterium]|nr:MAG: hypothetical protein DRQ59_00500 [Gammaproteobacteria bacterium]
MVYAYGERNVGLKAGELALRLLMHLLPDDLQEQVDYDFDKDFNWIDEMMAFIPRPGGVLSS